MECTGENCLLYESVGWKAPLTLQGVTAGPAVPPESLLNGPAQRPVSLKHLFTCPHCLGAGNHICLQIWLAVLQHKCFMPGSNILYILDPQHFALSLVSPTLYCWCCLSFYEANVGGSETESPERVPQIFALISYNRQTTGWLWFSLCYTQAFRKFVMSQMHHELSNWALCVCVWALTSWCLCWTPGHTITAALLSQDTIQHSALPHCWVSGHLWMC